MQNKRREHLKHWLRIYGVAATGSITQIRNALATDWPVTQGMQVIKGFVEINGNPAKHGAMISPGDTVTTGQEAVAVYVMGKDAFLQRGSTETVFGHESQRFLRVITGKLLSVFGPGEKTIHVPTATIGIRGTACYIEATTNRTYFCLCYGTAEVTPLIAPDHKTTYSTQHHDHPIYIDNDPKMPTGMVGAEVINHWDAELEMLEALQGRKPDFGKY